MRIAIIHHNEDISNDYAAYLATLLDDTAKENGYVVKDHHILALSKEPLSEENVLLHVIIPVSGSFSMKFWYSVKLPAIFRKYNIGKVLCMYGVTAKTTIDQLLIIPDSAVLQFNKKSLLWQQFAAKRLKESIAASHLVIAYSAHIKNEVAKINEAAAEKTLVLPYTMTELFKPKEWHDKLYIKSKYAENKEYFVAILPDDDENIFTELLKSFSKFKKWQQSSMQLLLLPKEESFTRRIYDKLDSYKYRNDVKLINDADKKETADIIASAYVLLHVSVQDSDLWPVAAALQCGIPVIATFTESLPEYCGEAALLIKEEGHEAFGEELIRLYKDETLRTKMCEAAIEKAKQLQQKEFAARLWELINEKP